MKDVKIKGGHTTPQKMDEKMAHMTTPYPSFSVLAQRASYRQKIRNQMRLVRGHMKLLEDLVKGLDGMYPKQGEKSVEAYRGMVKGH